MGNIASSSSLPTTLGDIDCDHKWYTGETIGQVKVCSRRLIPPFEFGIHHYIIVSIPGKDYLIVHEWDNTGNKSYKAYNLHNSLSN